MKAVYDFFISVLTKAPIFIGLIVLLGYVLQRKPFGKSISGGFKAFAGMAIELAGVDIACNALIPLSNAFGNVFAVEQAVPLGSYTDFLNSNGAIIGSVMVITLVAVLVIAKFTPFKAIGLNGGWYICMPTLFLGTGIVGGLSGVPLYIFTLLFSILFAVISPYLLIKPCENLVGARTFTIHHTANIFCLLGDFIGRFIGDPKKSTEDIKISDKWAFVKDNTFISAIFIAVIYMVVGLVIGPDLCAELYGSDPLFVFSIMSGAQFAAGLVVMLQGVRMVVSEIVPAFNGFANKLIPNAVPGLDIPLVFPYGPNALFIGFLVSLVTSMLTLFVLGHFKLMTFPLLPLTIACYFDVAPGAIFANKRGGITAAVVTSALGGILMMILVNVTLPMCAETVGNYIQAYGGNGYSVWVAISHFGAKIFSLFGK